MGLDYPSPRAHDLEVLAVLVAPKVRKKLPDVLVSLALHLGLLEAEKKGETLKGSQKRQCYV